MQRPDEAKRLAIMKVAAAMFAQRPYHEVRLDDVAEAARVGKGTLYIYFRSKEHLYGSLVLEGFAQLIDRLSAQVHHPTCTAWETLSLIIREFVAWAASTPHLFQLIRPGQLHDVVPGLPEKRRELGQLIERVIRRGNETGEFDDPHPEITAQFIPSCVRGAIRHVSGEVDHDILADHLMRVISRGIRKEAK